MPRNHNIVCACAECETERRAQQSSGGVMYSPRSMDTPDQIANRKHRLVDCNPHFFAWGGGQGSPDALSFDCPEGHTDCKHYIPFTPALDGSDGSETAPRWQRTGSELETLTLKPSIRSVSVYCAMHIFITDGQIIFWSDSH